MGTVKAGVNKDRAGRLQGTIGDMLQTNERPIKAGYSDDLVTRQALSAGPFHRLPNFVIGMGLRFLFE